MRIQAKKKNKKKLYSKMDALWNPPYLQELIYKNRT